MDSGLEIPRPLQTVVRLFERLNEEEVRYCHWKSTWRLPVAMAGKTDLDLLVDRGQTQQFRDILAQLDFKPFLSHPRRQYPAIEDYLGFDRTTGRLIHLHVHYRLVLGEQFVKNYYLPFEKSFLENTQLREGVKVPIPELEIIVLVLRALLKYRDRDAIRDMFRLGRSSGIPAHILGEFTYLRSQTDLDGIACALSKHASPISAGLVLEFLTTIERAPRAGWTLFRLRQRVRQELAQYQRQSRGRARLLYYRAVLAQQWPFQRLTARILASGDKRKIPASGGLTVAFVGTDGAGKSTVIRDAAKWLSWRVNVHTYYMGSSQPSRLTATVKRISKVAQRLHSGCRRLFGDRSLATRVVAGPGQLFVCLRYVADARDRYNRYRAGRQKAAQGSIVIYDRYPLESVSILGRPMDGARIAATSNGHMGSIAGALARIEEGFYARMLPAEHLFVLHVSPEVSHARKPEHARELVEAKSKAIGSIPRNGVGMTEIDADQPFEQVLLQVKSALWDLL